MDINGSLLARGQAIISNPSNSNCTLVVGDSNLLDYGPLYGTVNIARYANDYARSHLAFIWGGSYVWEMGYVNNSNNFGVFPYNYNPSSGNSPLLSLTTDLKVGINTPTPQSTLDVNGDCRVSGSLTTSSINTSSINTNSITGISSLTLSTLNLQSPYASFNGKINTNGYIQSGSYINIANMVQLGYCETKVAVTSTTFLLYPFLSLKQYFVIVRMVL